MKLRISAIGKLKSGPEQELFSRYLKRARGTGVQLGFPTISHHQFPESKNTTGTIRKQQEAELLFSTTAKGNILLIFDENGKDFSSSEFAHLLANQRDQGAKELTMALGGPDGLDREFVGKANFSIRFGSMTWPHQIARILLAEQIYRAMTILAGHPYHRQ
ncbi:MAG: 23S rRNA (pseudouridine(1915)-N(3))-methyltransferase RlmH [Hyphomicrobiales bacterium]|nr:23S rRNA (pseudouridine(1915)-N(3))-methyltransferase RlmH [Hyphomicrobiales bacterium]